MNLALTDQQQDIAVAVDRFLTKELSLTRVRELASLGAGPALDDAAWRTCAGFGWLGLGLPEAHGGLALGARHEVMLARELGRHVTPGPFRSTILAAHAAAAAGNDELARSLAGGTDRAGIEVGDLSLDVAAGDVVVRTDGAATVELARVEAAEVVPGVDPGIRFARVTAAHPLLGIEDPALLTRARLLAAAELLGVIEAVRDMSAHYAGLRVQFGRPIGVFQAVKHRCADMAIAAYAALAQVLFAAHAFDDDHPDATFHAAAAYLLAASGAQRATADNIQNHGAIGFTLEHDAHLFLRRALVLQHLLGPPRRTMTAVLAPERHEFR